MAEPFEIMAVPFDVYLAPAATAKPAIDADLTTIPAWVLLGSRGADEYDEGGITVGHEQEINLYRGLRGTGPVKAFRTSEGLTFGFTLNDLTVESYAKVVNDADVDATSGNSKLVSLHQGPQVSTFALLAVSADGPYGDGFPCQYWVPNCFQSASPSVVHRKGTPAGLALVFTAMENLAATDDSERFGVFEAATEAPGS